VRTGQERNHGNERDNKRQSKTKVRNGSLENRDFNVDNSTTRMGHPIYKDKEFHPKPKKRCRPPSRPRTPDDDWNYLSRMINDRNFMSQQARPTSPKSSKRRPLPILSGFSSAVPIGESRFEDPEYY